MSNVFLQFAVDSPQNEVFEEYDVQRILYLGLEVATVSCNDDKRWATLYAQSPALVLVLRELLKFHPPMLQGRCPICERFGDMCAGSKAANILFRVTGEETPWRQPQLTA